MEKNYSKEQHEISWELEKKFYEEYKDKLIWNNENWDHKTTYDSDGKGLGDFQIKGTDWKIELQKFNFDSDWVYVFGRRLYEVDNLAGKYGAIKDIKKTIQVAYNGKQTAWIELKDFDWSNKFDDFAGKRFDWEICYGVNFNKMKRSNFNMYIFLKQNSKD